MTDIPSPHMRRKLQFVVSLTIAAALLILVLRQFDLNDALVTVRHARPGLMGTGLAFMALAYVVRALRWRIWERTLLTWDSFRLILIGFMGNNLLPARLGEVLRAHCAAEKLGTGRTSALASVAAERVLDGLVLGILGLAGIVLVPVDRALTISLLVASAAFAGVMSGLVLTIKFHQWLRRGLDTLHRLFPGHLTRFARAKANYFLDGLLPLSTWGRLASALLTTGIVWGLEVFFYLFLGRSMFPEFSPAAAILFLAVVNFASLFPLTMGGIGTIEAAGTLFLVSAGLPKEAALAIVVSQHASQFLFTSSLGLLFYFTGRFHEIPLIHPASGRRPLSAPAGPPGAILLSETRAKLDALREAVPFETASERSIDLSIVIPAYNEQARLPKTVLETIQWGTARNDEYEIIIVDDGSRDQTLALARLFEAHHRCVKVLASPHMGKGAAVRLGMLNAKGQRVLFMDADGATPLDEIPKLTNALCNGSDVALGSRVAQQPGEVHVETSLHRRMIGRVFAFLVNVAALSGVADSQCGFKMFRANVVRPIFSRQRILHFAFDVEILHIARKLGLSVEEIPVNWVSQPGSKVNIVTDSARMLWDILRIRWLHRHLGLSPIEAAEISANTPSAQR